MRRVLLVLAMFGLLGAGCSQGAAENEKLTARIDKLASETAELKAELQKLHTEKNGAADKGANRDATVEDPELKKAHTVFAAYLQACITFGYNTPSAQERLCERLQKEEQGRHHGRLCTAYAINSEKMSPDRNDEAVFVGTVEAAKVFWTSPPPGKPNETERVGFKARVIKVQEQWKVDWIEYDTTTTTENKNTLIVKHRSALQLSCRTCSEGYPVENAFDGKLQTFWYSAIANPGGDNKQWIQVTFPEDVTVNRVTILGNRDPAFGTGWTITSGHLEFFDAAGKQILWTPEADGIGTARDFDWKIGRPQGGVRSIKFTASFCGAIGEFQVE